MSEESLFDTVLWYIKCLGLPLFLSATIYKILQRLTRRKRRSQLQGKVVVITGASSGIGEALAHSFYENGSKVVLAARRESELQRVKEDLISKKLSVPVHQPIVLKLDLADLDSLKSFVESIYEKCGHIDVLINNGGISVRSSILDTNIDVDRKIMEVNYFGSVYLTKAILPGMVKNRSGHIVFMSSVQGRIALPDRSAYAASKHAMQAFADSLRAEMNQYKVNVSVVSPGYVKTAVSLNALTGSGESHGVMDDSTARGYSPEYIAEETLDLVVNKDNEITPSQFLAKFAIFCRYFAPNVYFWAMSKRAETTKL